MTDEYGNEIVEDESFVGDEGLEDNPLYDALSSDQPSDKDDDKEEELDEFDPSEGDSAEVLKTKLAAKSRILRQRGKSNARLKDRVDELEAKLSAGAGGMDKEAIAELISVAKGGTDDDPEKTEQERIQALKDQYDEDPTSIVDILTQASRGTEDKLAQILQNRDAYWEEKINALTNQRIEEQDPEVTKMVGLLKQKEEYKNVDEATLRVFAKDLVPMRNRVRRPPATTTGGGNLPINAGKEQVEQRFASALDSMGYGSDND